MKKRVCADELTRQLDAYAANSEVPERSHRSRWGNWPMYAAATGAALAGASAATADIVYSGPVDISGKAINIVPKKGYYFPFGVNTDIWRHLVSTTPGGGRGMTVGAVKNLFATVFPFAEGPGNPAAAVFSSNLFAKNFAPGSPIGPGISAYARRNGPANIATEFQFVTYRGVGSGAPRGPFQNPGFLGFEMFQQTSQLGIKPGSVEYGWMQVQFNSADGGSIEVFDWAYSTDGPINAGDTGSGNALPEPSPFPVLLLAAGAAGVTAWKRRRKQTRNA